MEAYSELSVQMLAEHLHSARHQIYTAWFDRLQRHERIKNRPSPESYNARREAGDDLFSALLESFKRGFSPSRINIEGLYRKCHGLNHAVSDFHSESLCLEESIEASVLSSDRLEDKQKIDAIRCMHARLGIIMGHVLHECTKTFAGITESSKTAFCQTDTKGAIVFANREMARLADEDSIIGKRLSDYFMDDDREIINASITQQATKSPAIGRMTMLSAKGKRAFVGVEIGPVIVDDHPKGGYAYITDISVAEEQRNRLYERSLLGIVNLNRKGDIVYANKSMLQMLNIESYQDTTVFDFLPDARSRELVQAQLDSRFGWQSAEYPLELVRAGDNIHVAVMVSAFPQTDLNGERVIGSFAIVRSLLDRQMHEHIESNHNEIELLRGVMKGLSLVIPYDLASVNKYSHDNRYLCSIFSYDIINELVFKRRWWKLSPNMIESANQKVGTVVPDLEAFLSHPDMNDVREEPDMQALLKAGYKSLLRYPVFRDNRLVASLTLLSKTPDNFKERHLNQLDNLPIRSAVHMALYYYEGREPAFVSDLIMNFTNAGNDIKALARIITESVSTYFKRHSVALFKLNRKEGKIELVDQAATEHNYLIEKGYKQSAEEGVLGYVCRHGTVENIGHIQKDTRFKNIYRRLSNTVTMRSELCIPIPFGGALWLLNIEDEQVDAFSEEEKNELCRVMEEVRNYLEKTWLSHFLESFLASASDAVLVTDNEGRVVQANRTALSILPIPQLEEDHLTIGNEPSHKALRSITPVALREIFVTPEDADKMVADGRAPIKAVDIRRRSGGIFPAILAVVDLQEDFGRSIYIATDLSAQQKLKEIENLEKIYHELAIQTKTPLSLAAGWIGRLKAGLSNADQKDTIDKILRQLNKLEITYNRLALCGDDKESMPFNQVLLDASELVEDIKNGLPTSEQSRIEWRIPQTETSILGDLFQLRFCLETILSYLLRFVPENLPIVLEVTNNGREIAITISGWLPKPEHLSTDDGGLKLQLSQSLADLCFGKRLLQHIIVTLHGGAYQPPSLNSDIAVFNITLPLWEGGRHAP